MRLLCLLAGVAILGGARAVLAAEGHPPPQPPQSILDPASWTVAEARGNTFGVSEAGGKPAIVAAGRQLLLVTPREIGPDHKVTVVFRLTDAQARSSITLATGLAEVANLRETGHYATVSAYRGAISWVVHDPDSTFRLPQERGTYRPQFDVARSLAWPESLRANVEADMVASKPVEQRWLTLEMILREHGCEVLLDGIPLTNVDSETITTKGFARLTVSPNVEVARVTTETVPPADEDWTFRPVSLKSVLNAANINGAKIDRKAISKSGEVTVAGVPFTLTEPDDDGNDHVDVGVGWFRQGNLDGRYSGRGSDAMVARWAGAMIKDPARITLRLPMARYRALHLLAAADDDDESTPVITAQFYRAQSGFPKNFAARVPAFTAKASEVKALPVKSTNGAPGRLYLVTIPVEPGALAEFDDLDYVDVELTKQVKLYRASPDPMYYSFHAAGLPSSVHVFALTAERPAVEVDFQADAYAHIWTAPEKPKYTVTLRNRTGPQRTVKLDLTTTSLDGQHATSQSKSIELPATGQKTVAFPLRPKVYGYHDVKLTITDGEQSWAEPRSLAYLHEDTRERGDWDFGRGPLFGFWNWGGSHVTPSAEKQLLAMAKAGVETTPGSYEEYIRRHGEETRKVMEQYKLFTLKFAGGGDHYITAKFAATLKKEGLQKAREEFLAALNDRKSSPGPNSRPIFLSFYPEPSIGPLTHGIFPHFIGQPEQPMSDYEQERYEMFLNGFLEGAKIVNKEFPEVKCLLPHGDPTFVIHFLRRDPEVAKLIDGICVDIPCFERLPEQQFHQVSVHRLYMARKELADAGVANPLLPMYEGPCIPSGPGALTEREQSDLTIRNSLILQVYGVNIQNGGFPAFDTASYWGEQHYGGGVLHRVSLETPKPAYAALATLTRHLNRKNFNKWIATGSHSTYALQFKHYKTGKLVHVMWTLRGRRPVTLTVPKGADVKVYDHMDNVIDVARGEAAITFTVDQSPCYIEGLSDDAEVALGEPDNRDSQPAENVRKLANFGDGSWKISKQQEPGYEESHTPYIFRYPSEMTARPVEAPQAQGGKALSVHFPEPEQDRVFVPYYSVLTPAKPIEIPGQASHLGMWVKGASDWGRAIYFVRDAKGEQWINIGTRGQWNCDDLHSWMSFNFDGWRYLRMEMPANSPYDQYREAGSAWWGPYSEGDGAIDLPLTLEKVVVERRTHVMYVDDPQPADRSDVLLGDLYAEYASPEDATPRAARLAAVRMPVPKDVKGLGNSIAAMRAADGAAPPITIERITLPEQAVDGTQCYVHFPTVAGATQYDVWAAPYQDGRGALQLGKAWKEPGGLIRGLRPNQDFYLFVTYTNADGAVSKPSPPLKINLKDFFGMK
ncbi:MAG: hypothetical protein RIC55_00595 [Pirellulaceae bacterium]